METERIIIGEAGWCRVVGGAYEAASRFAVAPSGRLALRAISMAWGPEHRGGDILRGMPLGRLEAWANGPGAEALRLGIKSRADLDADALDAEDARWASLPARRASWGTAPTAEGPQEATLAALAAPSGAGLVLCVPEGPRRPMAFYENVARVYAALGAASARPAALLAEANGVEVAAVYAWVREARRRGLLPPGRREVRRGRRE